MPRAPCILVGDAVDAYAAAWRSALGERADLIPFARTTRQRGIVAGWGVARAAGVRRRRSGRSSPLYVRPPEAELTHGRRAATRSAAGSQAGGHELTAGSVVR